MRLRALVIFIILTAMMISTISVVYSSNISSDYSYHKTNHVAGSPDGTLADYQVMYVIHRGNGTDFGNDVYLDGLSMSWPNDTRFTDIDGNAYPYWIESFDNNSATVWVKIASIPRAQASADVVLCYGKANDVSASNGDQTFVLFDDFNGNSLDTNKWVKVMGDASADALVQNQELELRSGTITDVSRPFVRSAKTYSGNYTIDVKAKYTGLNSIIIVTNWDGTLAGQYRGPDRGYECYYNSWADNYQYWEIARDDKGNNGVNLGQFDQDLDNEFHTISVTQKPQITLAVDDQLLLSGASDTTYTSGYVGLGGREDQRAIQTYYDDFRMRSYTANPPVPEGWSAGIVTTKGFFSPDIGLMALIFLALVLVIILGLLAVVILLIVLGK